MKDLSFLMVLEFDIWPVHSTSLLKERVLRGTGCVCVRIVQWKKWWSYKCEDKSSNPGIVLLALGRQRRGIPQSKLVS